MEDETKVHNGALRTIDTCLGLSSGQELLILFDETTYSAAHLLMESAYEIDVKGAATYVPTSIQAKFDHAVDLPSTLVSAIRDTTGILTCLADDPALLPFRKKVFRVGLGYRSKIGHMPGVTLDSLAMADVDYRKIRADCELLACALLKGENLELVTCDSQGNEHCLTMDIGGWSRPPTISDGLIEKGCWANIPPGETFIAPIEGTAHGTTIVDGSLPGYVLPPGSQVVLRFEAGRLVEYRSEDRRCVEIIDRLREFGQQKNDPNWCNLAEVGLGVNHAVQLTGVELLDEKKYGTAHIAIGDNDWFGGTVSSVIHSDWIIREPLVRIDGRTVLKKGRVRTGLTDLQEDHRHLALDPDWGSNFSLSRSGTRGVNSTGLLRREWISGRGESHLVQVGKPASAHMAAYLYAQIPPPDAWIEMQALLDSNSDLDAQEIRQLVWLMHIYDLVRLV